MSNPACGLPTKPADDSLLAALQPLDRHAGVFIAPAEIADAAPERPACVLVAGGLAPRRGFSELLDAQADLRAIAALSSAEEALVTAERERIDAVLVDYKLGDHDGLWVIRALKRLSRPPRVVLRCESPHGLLAAAVLAEADALVSTSRLSISREPAGSESPRRLPGRRYTELCRGAVSPNGRRSSVRPTWPGHAGPLGRERPSAERHISGAQSKGDLRA